MATWDVEGNYGYGHGWEHVDSADTEELANEAMRVYRENEPGVPFRVVPDLSSGTDDYSYSYVARLVADS